MSDDQAAEAPPQKQKKTRSFTSLTIFALLAIALALLGWWYVAGGGEDSFSSMFSQDRAAQTSAPQAIDMQAIADRLSALESATLALEAARSEHEMALSSMDEFARQEDVLQSAALLRAEIRATRDAFPKTIELEHSQAALALRLLELAEIEHRLLGDSKALVSLIKRVQALLRGHPHALDLHVDLVRLSEDIAAAEPSGQLELAETLRALSRNAGKVPLIESQFDMKAEASSGLMERVAAGLRSLVRIRRLDSPDGADIVTRAPLVLALERMQVALLRREHIAFERERAFAVDWAQQHAEMESPLTRELLAALETLEGVDLGVQRDDFGSLIARLGELQE